MKLFLSHTTSLLFWRMASACQADKVLPCYAVPSTNTMHNIPEALLAVEGTPFQNMPLHIALPARTRLANSKRITYHSSKHYQAGHFRRWSKNICISSPELTFFQMAPFLELPELVMLGNEFCGTYVFDPFSTSKISPRPALTTRKLLMRFLRSQGPVRGKDKASHALRFISDGTASPAESELAAHFMLSKRYGGAGFPPFACNQDLTVPSHLVHLSKQNTIRPDMLWPSAMVALEYDSNNFHTGADRIAHDSVRRNTLIAMGYNVICITRGQTQTARGLIIEDQKIAHALRVRWRTDNVAFESKARAAWSKMEHWAHMEPEQMGQELEFRFS